MNIHLCLNSSCPVMTFSFENDGNCCPFCKDAGEKVNRFLFETKDYIIQSVEKK